MVKVCVIQDEQNHLAVKLVLSINWVSWKCTDWNHDSSQRIRVNKLK